jgi:hypothetical protein
MAPAITLLQTQYHEQGARNGSSLFLDGMTDDLDIVEREMLERRDD